MKVTVSQGSEEINSIGGISLIGGLFDSLKILKKGKFNANDKGKNRKNQTLRHS